MSAAFDVVVRDTRRWLERAVIGLNLCPFAKAVHVRGQVHYAVSKAGDAGGVLEDLASELAGLMACAASERETTLLIVPDCLDDFLEFNALLARANRVVRKKGLEGVVQLASFHPGYRFAGTEPEDITNFSNRSPYPMLHLLREESIARSVRAIADPQTIYEANMQVLTELGRDGWDALAVGRTP